MLSAIRTFAAIGFAFALVVTNGSWASAGDGGVNCGSGSCTVTVTVPGSPAGSVPTSPETGVGPVGGQIQASPSPSGSFFNIPCTYRPDPEYQPPAGADPHPSGSGGWYLMTCPDALKPTGVANTFSTVVWLSTPPPPAATGPSPAQLAAQARSLLRLTTPVIGSSPKPGEPDLVGLNLWAWVAPSVWSAQSATASAGGLSVTATATPSYATWDFGDGTVITCAGPGTVYQPSDGANPVSPTCGHDYRQAGSFTVTVTVHWAVAWAGAGQSGAFNDMTTTARAPVTVEQSQAVVTR